MSWDYIVIGAGSAGCALVYGIAQAQPSAKILVLEAGGSDRSPLIKLPMWQVRASLKYDWGYRSQPDPSRNGTSEKWKRGRVLGGSSSVNGMMYIHGAAGDFDRWAELCGHTGEWSAMEIQPIFRDMESSDQIGPWRGDSGPLRVSTVRHPHAITKGFVESVCAAGYTYNEDYNGALQNGVSYLQRSVYKGFRTSSADAFLKPLLGKPNVTLFLNALVEQIEVVNGRAAAVSFYRDGEHRRETARDIILCAGAINSPQLLMLSGIGDAKDLKRHGIEVVIDRPSVGRNLREHPHARMIYRCKIPTCNPTEGFGQKLGIFAKFLRYREGPIAGAYEACAFLSVAPQAPTPDFQLLFAPLGVEGKIGGALRLASYPACQVAILRSHPASSGCIRLASRDPKVGPLIEGRLLAEPADVEAMMRGIELVRHIMRKDPIASLLDCEITPGAEIKDKESLARYVRDNTEVAFHPIGTCRMGIDSEAVLDPNLRVRGTENLWVADASIMPDHISANINAACMMIGAKLGKQLAARRS
jgi:choline dehydrogenase-like flavoprotein